MKTFLPNAKAGKLQWHVMDADGVVLGRLASTVAAILRGKHKPTFTPHLALGDGVIVVNAGKVRLTGRKAQREFVYRHSGYPGGLRRTALGDLLRAKPERLVAEAVRGMLPKNTLGRKLLRRLRVYRGPSHGHSAQQPTELKIDRRGGTRVSG